MQHVTPTPVAATAAAASSALGDRLTVGVDRCANALAVIKKNGKAEIDRFIMGMLRFGRQ